VNVLFLTHNFPRRPGDASGSFLLRLASALRGEDVHVRVVAPTAPGFPEQDTMDDIPVQRFRYAPRSLETLAYSGNMAEQVKQSLGAKMAMVGFLGAEFRCAVHSRREFQPDLVHAHWWFPNGVAGAWLSQLAHIPLVTTLHGTDVRMARMIKVSRPAFRHVLRHSAAVTTVSRWLADEATRIVSSPTEFNVAPMPVSTSVFQPDGRTRAADRLLFVGRLNKQKGLELLLRAMAAMETRVSLDVVGDGEEAERLRQLAATLEIEDRVTWHGGLVHERLVDMYRSATALVVPSMDEGLGLVAVEAQLCETPVVAFDSGGLRDVIQNERTGLLVSPINFTALASALDALLARPDRGATLGQAGRMQALGAFAPESVARRYADLYRNVLAAHRP